MPHSLLNVFGFKALPSQPFYLFLVLDSVCVQIQYKNGQSVVEVDGRATKKLITNLEPDKEYSFVLTNRGNTVGGLQQTVSARTAPAILGSKPYLIKKVEPDGTLMVRMPEVETVTPVIAYYIIVVPLKKSHGKFVNIWHSPDEMDLEE
ncbi:hypothetical protein scyTo_0026175, partial [Scyliorhinus torazame]|nr:hypothetical protein [Scyliorhinus torazame]